MNTSGEGSEGIPESNAERYSIAPHEFIKTLSEDERALVVMRDELYESSWQRMRTDLKNRLTGKPYIYKLVNKIEADLSAIDRLEKYESENAVDLRRLLDEER